MQTVRISVTRNDLFSGALGLFWQRGDFWRGWAFWAVVFGVFLAYRHGFPSTPRSWAALLIGAVFGAAVTQIVIVAWSLWRMARYTTKTDGVLGEHEYQIRDEGLFEKTPANETLNLWRSVRSIRRNARYIFIEAPSRSFHFIPRSSFPSDADFELFWQDLRAHVQKAALQRGDLPEGA